MQHFARYSVLLLAFVLFSLGLGACSSGQMRTEPGPQASPSEPPASLATRLPDLGPAPGFTNDVWINSDEPLTLEQLRGKVVLVEFWTFD